MANILPELLTRHMCQRSGVQRVKGITDVIGRILNKYYIRPVFKPLGKIKNLLHSPKDYIPSVSRGGIYKIFCECGDVYIEQMSRSISCNLKEHERSNCLAQRSQQQRNMLSVEDTKFYRNKQKLTRTSQFKHRIFREALEIMKHPSNFNRDGAMNISRTWEILLKEKYKIHRSVTQEDTKGKKVTNIPNESSMEIPSYLTRTHPYVPQGCKGAII